MKELNAEQRRALSEPGARITVMSEAHESLLLTVAMAGIDRDAMRGLDVTPYTPEGSTPHTKECATINATCDECDCGAWENDARRRELASAVVGAMTVGMVKRERCFERFMMTLNAAGFEVVKRDRAPIDSVQHDLDLAYAALKRIDETVPSSIDVMKPLPERVHELVRQHGRMEGAIRWALGEHKDGWQEPNMDGRVGGKFWWRRDLRARAFGG